VRRAVTALLLVAVTIVACGPTGTASTATGAPGSPVIGVITAVDSAGLSDVRGFTIRTDDGRSLTFVLGPLENATEFPPGHLGEHLATSEPVRVFFRLEGASMLAYRIEDAAD
jgi:hypothetical protein